MQITWKIKYQTETFSDWFAVRNIRDDEALANLAKISLARIKLVYNNEDPSQGLVSCIGVI